MMICFAAVQGDHRYCVVGYVDGDKERPDVIGWTSDASMAEKILEVVQTRWSKYRGVGKILDFKRRITSTC